MKIVLVGVNATFNHTNLAIKSIRQYCQNAITESIYTNNVFDFACLEFTINDSIRDNVAILLNENATVYGFSCYIWNIKNILEITEILKKIEPRCIIVLGGPEVSFENDEFFNNHEEVDYIIKGPGEKAFYELIKQIAQNAAMSNQRNDITIQDNAISNQIAAATSQGNTISNLITSAKNSNISTSKYTEINVKNSKKIIDGERTLLVQIPFVYSSEDFVIKQKQYYYETTRGCPFNCSYCLSSVTREMDILPVERVKREMKFFIDQGIKQVKLVDRTFNYDDKRALEIWRFLINEYAKEPFKTNFHFEITVDLLSQESLLLLREAPEGLFQFEIGVQTTNEKVLKNINRKSFLDKVFSNVIKLKENGNISLHLDLIAGLPGEDWKSFAKSFHQVFSLKPDMLQLGFLKVLKGSPIRIEASDWGIIYSNNPPYEVLASDVMTFQQLIKLKNIESLLDRYYNSSQFYYSMGFLVEYFENSFELFESLEKHWSKKDLFKRNISRQESIREFYLFGQETIENKFSDNKDLLFCNETKNIFVDLLKFDYYRFDKKGNIEELNINFGLHHPDLPRDHEKACWYQANGQPVCGKPRLEKYSFDVKSLIESKEITKRNSYILYEMNGDKPVIFDILNL